MFWTKTQKEINEKKLMKNNENIGENGIKLFEELTDEQREAIYEACEAGTAQCTALILWVLSICADMILAIKIASFVDDFLILYNLNNILQTIIVATISMIFSFVVGYLVTKIAIHVRDILYNRSKPKTLEKIKSGKIDIQKEIIKRIFFYDGSIRMQVIDSITGERLTLHPIGDWGFQKCLENYVGSETIVIKLKSINFAIKMKSMKK